jgi:hypothetical protein
VIEIEPACGLGPCIKVVVSKSIYARLCDSVLSGCIKSLVEFEYNCDGIGIPREVNEVPELIDVCLDVSPALEILLGL